MAPLLLVAFVLAMAMQAGASTPTPGLQAGDDAILDCTAGRASLATFDVDHDQEISLTACYEAGVDEVFLHIEHLISASGSLLRFSSAESPEPWIDATCEKDVYVGRTGPDGLHVYLWTDVIIGAVSFVAPNGAPGQDVSALGCMRDAVSVHAGDGGDAGSVTLFRGLDGAAEVVEGNGGDGGHALAEATCPEPCEEYHGTNASAPGEGGEDLNRTGPDGEIDGINGTRGTSLRVFGGHGGAGVAGGQGGNATALAGSGGSGIYDDSLAERLGGFGGDGGNALAVAGNGGSGTIGGAGGNAWARAGRGGDGADVSAPELPGNVQAGGGGGGGTAHAHGGNGGSGTTGDGGDGGNARAESGNGGNGGDAMAPEGRGGDAGDAGGDAVAFGGDGNTSAAGHGGDGGDAFARGGSGGQGGDGVQAYGFGGDSSGFQAEAGEAAFGFDGGNGGDATGIGGSGGDPGDFIGLDSRPQENGNSSTNGPEKDSPGPGMVMVAAVLIALGVVTAKRLRRRP